MLSDLVTASFDFGTFANLYRISFHGGIVASCSLPIVHRNETASEYLNLLLLPHKSLEEVDFKILKKKAHKADYLKYQRTNSLYSSSF